jgi:hypothetical protein
MFSENQFEKKIVTDITAHSRIKSGLCVGVCPTRYSDSGTLNFMKLERKKFIPYGNVFPSNFYKP